MDLEACPLGYITSHISYPYLGSHPMFLGGESASTSGEIVHIEGNLVVWGGTDNPFADMPERTTYRPGDALIILEIQRRIYQFLGKCYQETLHDMDPGKLILEGARISPEP